MNYKKSKLIVRTFDGIMKKLNIIPKSKDSKVEFQINYYNDDDAFTEATVLFEGVIAVDCEVNYFDYSNPDNMLNDRETAIELFQQLDNYHLYQQQTRGGIFYILANNYRLIDK